MSSRVRITAGLLAGAAVCAAAAGIGWAVGPLERDTAETEHADEVMAMPEGLAVAADGYRLQVERSTLTAGRPQELSLRIADDGEEPVTDFELEHEKGMHLIVVRRDLTGFQHLHPSMSAGGTWTASAAPLAPGAYRVFADFKTDDRHTLGGDVVVPGAADSQPLPAPATTARAGDYEVALQAPPLHAEEETELAFHVTRDGRPVEVGRYLGARGHLVILREGDLAYLHNHADEDQLAFESTFPSAGRYRAFLQFAAGGEVQTAAFTLEVTPDE